jgi:hypothetical protein
LRAALDRAADSKAVYAGGINVMALPPLPPNFRPPPPFNSLLPLLKAESAGATLDLAGPARLDLSIRFATDADATEGEKALHAGRKTLLDLLPQFANAPLPAGPDGDLARYLLREANTVLQGAAIGRQRGVVDVRLTSAGLTDRGPDVAVAMTTAVQRVRDSAARLKAMNNLKQVVLAIHNYNDAYQGRMPAHAIYSKDGRRPLLSWRVAILPYIEQDGLYRRFRHDEPWDSEHNKKLIAEMPEVYLAPNAVREKDPGRTHYQVFVGGGAVWDRGPMQPNLPRTFRDGTSNTLLVVEAADPVIWTKPDDLAYDPNKPVPKLGASRDVQEMLVGFADGSVQPLRRTVREATLRALITAAGGEQINRNELDR